MTTAKPWIPVFCREPRLQTWVQVSNLHLPLPDALIMVGKARAGSGKRTFKPLREGYLHHDIWPNLANEANYLRGPGTDFCHRSQHICEPPISYHIFSFSTFLSTAAPNLHRLHTLLQPLHTLFPTAPLHPTTPPQLLFATATTRLSSSRICLIHLWVYPQRFHRLGT